MLRYTVKHWKDFGWPLLKRVIIIVVLLAVGKQLYSGWMDASNETENLELRPLWLLASGCCYMVSWIPASLWWRHVLQGLDVTPTLSDILRAYNVGHLGKYVPGKMLVPVLRSGLLHAPDVSPGKVVISVVYETISTMAVGGWVALLLFFLLDLDLDRRVILLPLFMALAVTPVLVIPVFNHLLRWLTVSLPGDVMVIRGLNFRSVLFGFLGLAVGWGVMGLALGMTLYGVGAFGHVSFINQLTNWPVWTFSTSFAVLGGFAAIWFPAGLGVREGLLVTVLAPSVGTAAAIGGAIVWRLVNVVSEAVVGGGWYVLWIVSKRSAGEERSI